MLPFPAGPTVGELGATPQQRNADPGAHAAGRSRRSPSVVRWRSNCGRPAPPYREIARQLGVDVHTAHSDIAAELADLRTTTIDRAEELRDLELQRFDEMTAGLWPQIQRGSPPAVTAAVRVSERRARLLGLDEPVVTKNELSGGLSVSAQKYAAEKELFLRLPVEQLEALAREHQVLLDKAFALARAHGVTVDAATARDAPVAHSDGRDAPDRKGIGTDTVRAGDGDRSPDPDRAQEGTTSMLSAVSALSAAAAGDACGDGVESNSEIVDNATVVDET